MSLETEGKPVTPPELHQLLDIYGDLFQESSILSPSRGHFDHKIPLKEGTSPINLRPYRYYLKHKGIIEKLEAEIQDKGVVAVPNLLLPLWYWWGKKMDHGDFVWITGNLTSILSRISFLFQ